MRRVIAAIAGLTLSGGVVACGQSSLHSESGDDTPATTSSRQESKAPQGVTHPVRPYRTAFEMFSAVQQQVRARGGAKFTETVQGDPLVIGEDGTFTWDGSEFSLKQTTRARPGKNRPPVDSHLSLAKEVLYQEMVPSLSGYEPPQGRPWLRVAADERHAAAASERRALRTLPRTTLPLQGLDALAGAASITGSAKESVDSIPATRYDVDLDVAKAIGLASDADQQEELTVLKVPTVHYRLWVADDDVPLRVASDAPLADGTPASRVRTYTGWGQQEQILPPPTELTCQARELSRH